MSPVVLRNSVTQANPEAGWLPRLRRSLGTTFLLGFLFGLTACFVSGNGVAATLINQVRVASSGDGTRVVFDLSAAPSEQVFTLEHPDRAVIDLADARVNFDEAAWPDAQGAIKAFRAGDRGNGALRVVIDLAAPMVAHSFTMDPVDSYGYRLVVDLTGSEGAAVKTPPPPPPPPVAVKSLPFSGRDVIVAVDAGHGGQDPGAIGRHGTREKDVTLAIARKLKERIDSEPGMHAVLTRNGDYFVPLRERMVLARKQQADLFISIHANSVRDRSVAGASVYVLSAGRASNEAARMLADRENAADLMGNVSLEDKGDVLASVLLDLSQGASMSASNEAADEVLHELERVGPVVHDDVKHASLKVLTSPGMPSMLVETAFISNPREEAKLKSAQEQGRLADAMFAGVRKYFYDNPLPGTRIAQIKSRTTPGASTMTTVAAGGLTP